MKGKIKIYSGLAFVPFLGFLIVLFFGAFQIKRQTKRYLPTYGFMAFSTLVLAVCALLAFGVYYFFVAEQALSLRIILSLLLFYSATVCAALLSLAGGVKINKKYFERDQMQQIS